MTRILLISNEMTYSGAPHCLLMIAKILLRYGYKVSVWTLKAGEFSTEFKKLGINVICIPNERLKKHKNKFKIFNLVIVNTIYSYKAYKIARKYTPTIFYIMEAEQYDRYAQKKNLYTLLHTSKNLYCVSEYAQSWIRKRFKNNSKVIHNSVEDLFDNNKLYYKNSTLNFTIISRIEQTKGFHTVIQAVKNLSDDYQNRIYIKFAGKKCEWETAKTYFEDIMDEIKDINCIEYIGEIKNIEDKIQLYKDTDVVIVPSYDESCSLVALEGAMMACPLILTQNVGAKYIVNKNSGFIFDYDKPEQLSNIIKNIINTDIEKMGKFSRENYLKTSTPKIYEKNLLKMVKNGLKRNVFLDLLPYKIEKFKNNIFSIRNNGKHNIITILFIKLKFRQTKI